MTGSLWAVAQVLIMWLRLRRAGFFASPADSGYITGEVLTLLGGETTAG